MTNDPELCYLSIAELSQAYDERSLSPVEVTESYLRRIGAVDNLLRAYTTVTADRAIEQAAIAEKRILNGQRLSPLDGVPIGLKDLFDTVGIRTTANSPLFADRVPEVDATVVRKLKAAGAVFLGKLAMGEFAISGQKSDSPFAPARNPWNLERIPGGSSSGPAAAVCAGMCAGALGSDTGGSIRGPAAYCGIVGLKPSAGLVSRHRVIPLAWTLDQVGPMTRTVVDTVLLLEAISGYDPLDLGSVRRPQTTFADRPNESIRGLKIGLPLSLLADEEVHPDVMATYYESIAVLKGLGAQITEVELPEVVQYTSDVFLVILMSEAFALHEPTVRARLHDYGDKFINVPLHGSLYSASDYLNAQRARTLIYQAMIRIMETVDILALPTKSEPAPTPEQEAGRPTWKRYTAARRLFSLSGQPAVSVPCGFSEEKLPIGLQLAGRLFDDSTVLGVARAFEQATSWHNRRPPL